MRLVCHRTIPDDLELKNQWNALVQQMERPEVFYTYEWAAAVHRAYQAVFITLLMLAYEADSLIGVVSLASDAGQKNIFFLASTTADYCDFVSAPGRRMEFMDAVLVELRKSRRAKIVFANLPADSTTWFGLKPKSIFRRKSGFFMFARPAYSCSQVVLDREELAQDVQKSVGKRLQRYRKAMPHANRVSVGHSWSTSEIEQQFHRFAIAHIARFLSSGRISNLVTEARRRFLLELSKTLASSGSVVLSRLMLGERTIAWNYGFQFSGSYFWYQPTFDTEFQQYSPGLWLLSAIVEESCQSAVIKRVDLGLGAEGYKERLANGVRQTMHITMSASPVAYVNAALRHKSATLVKTRPGLERFTRSALRNLGKFRSSKVSEASINLFDPSEISKRQGEVLFLEWNAKEKVAFDFIISAIDLTLLAEAAMQYEHDQDTLEYILRAAKLLGTVSLRGLAITSESGKPEFFCWASQFDPSVIESANGVPDRSGSNILVFDFWISASKADVTRNSNLWSVIATHLAATGASPWAIAYDPQTTAALEASGFRSRFSARCGDQSVRKIVADMKLAAIHREREATFAAA